ncbi:hypothetical protein DPMN_077714 [Dreissena polymorpha]|uniref:Uncharacterized protein n=1 Tax=Dreissena polymorpha TaxID=45954 RepID=A0A9D3YR57_DREPO|nr:hypothetical protein DPMN_077714 [Dreissena polymorpha]
MLAHRQLFKEVDSMENPVLKDFTRQMLSKGQYMKEFLVTPSCAMSNPKKMTDESLLKKAAHFLESDHIDFQKVDRIRLKNGQLITSTNYVRMKKRICYAIYTNSGNCYCIRHFLYEKTLNVVLACGQKLNVNGLLHPTIDHLKKVVLSEETDIFNVESIKEKVNLLDGNTNSICISRLPNFLKVCM